MCSDHTPYASIDDVTPRKLALDHQNKKTKTSKNLAPSLNNEV